MSDDWQLLRRREESICYEIRRHYNLRDRVYNKKEVKILKAIQMIILNVHYMPGLKRL